ncbi:MAG: hypothetical protein Q4Q20_06230 [Methanocorpusculum sp.]|nr:hypothetical protein [Methanocorpusculum sp.]
MADITVFLIGLGICIVVAVGLTIVQIKLRKKADERKASQGKKAADAALANEKFVVGRIYQMPDKSLAKYIGDNKFLKVKEK